MGGEVTRSAKSMISAGRQSAART